MTISIQGEPMIKKIKGLANVNSALLLNTGGACAWTATLAYNLGNFLRTLALHEVVAARNTGWDRVKTKSSAALAS